MSGFLDATEYSHPSLPADHRYADLRGLMSRLDPVDAALASTARGVMNWHASHRFCSACGQPSGAALGGWGGFYPPRRSQRVSCLATAVDHPTRAPKGEKTYSVRGGGSRVTTQTQVPSGTWLGGSRKEARGKFGHFRVRTAIPRLSNLTILPRLSLSTLRFKTVLTRAGQSNKARKLKHLNKSNLFTM